MIMNSLKTLTAAAGLALVGFTAQAATVAEVTAEGDYLVLSNGTATGIDVSGEFTAFLDTGFDTSATNDFLFELNLKADGLPDIDEELAVFDTTGETILATVFSLIADINLALPGVLGAVATEVTDGNLDQSNIIDDIWLGFAFSLDSVVDDLGTGSFSIILSEGGRIDQIGGLLAVLEDGSFAGSATISTVSAVPLPATLPLLAFGGAGLMALGRRRKS